MQRYFGRRASGGIAPRAARGSWKASYGEEARAPNALEILGTETRAAFPPARSIPPTNLACQRGKQTKCRKPRSIRRATKRLGDVWISGLRRFPGRQKQVSNRCTPAGADNPIPQAAFRSSRHQAPWGRFGSVACAAFPAAKKQISNRCTPVGADNPNAASRGLFVASPSTLEMFGTEARAEFLTARNITTVGVPARADNPIP